MTASPLSPSPHTPYSPEATAAFAELVARHDRGEVVDFEAEFEARGATADALRHLHANWKRLDHMLGGLHVGESALDELEQELDRRRPVPPDESTRADLERLSSPERARARYVVRERLARGGMGEIWRVFDADLERDLAMKVIRARTSEGPKTLDGGLLRRFLFEARLTARLDHPGIAPVHDIGIDGEGRLFFTMPLVRGRSLSEILDLARDGREGWTRPRVLEIVLKVCDTLAYAHAQGVVHRDLKPANVMVGRFGETYVMDWGLARVLSELDELDRGVVLGTPAYMAPEQAKGRLEDVGPRSDVYALGAILYHLLAGGMPYAEHDSRAKDAVLDAVRSGPPRALEDLSGDAPPELAAIVRKAMARSADERYADMRAMAADLRAYMDGRVVRAHARGAWAELRKWIGRNRALVSVVGAAALVLVVGALWFAWAQARSANEILQLADLRRLDELEHRADQLWPAVPANEKAFEEWLSEARSLEDRALLHTRNLAELRRSALSPGPPWKFENNTAQWQHDTLTELVERLARFGSPRVGAVASVEQRIEESRRIARESLVDAAAAWQAAIASIRDPDECPMYRGLEIAPQVGLVPIGRDPVSHLWEFAHLPTGAGVQRAANGRLQLNAASAIVLVLAPGGSFHMGSKGPDRTGTASRTGAHVAGQPAETLTDSAAEPDEMPETLIEIGPFFVARHETTRAQWARLADATSEPAGDPLEPQASISWNEAALALHKAGLELPTEAQWEYAARAATITRWWTGFEPSSLRGAANGAIELDPRTGLSAPAGGPVPVDSLRANPFGLCNVLGNVAEWTRDVYADYSVPPSPSTGERIAPEDDLRSVRGGSYASPAAQLRCAARDPVARGNLDPHVGVRVVRAIDAPAR